MTAMATPSLRPRLECENRREWRAWLRQNHGRVGEVWLVFFKKHTGRPGVLYDEAVEEAICFGWIDGLKRRIDEDRYAFRFSPRRPRSKWSPRNVEVATRLLADGKMTKAGRLAFERRQSYDDSVLKPGTDVTGLPEDVVAENRPLGMK